MIRKATPADIPAIVALGIEALQKANHPGLVIAPKKLEAIARQCVTSAASFAWVAERDGVIGGALCALAHENMFYERHQLSVMQLDCTIPGDGVKLLRELLRWWQTRPMLKLLVVSLEHDADPRIAKLLRRLGLVREHPAFVISKGGSNV